MSSGARRRARRTTLACFVQALEGRRVVVELRYDTIVRGELLGADDQLNLQLGGATYQPLQGEKREMPYVYIKGRHVRFIHLPGSLDPAAAVEAHRKRVAAAVKEHERAQAQAAQRPGSRLAKGTQLELGPPSQQQAQQAPQQPGSGAVGGPTGMDLG
ncbi:hypothetical protein ABPG75_008126 [Micractinium tetrahymenae]